MKERNVDAATNCFHTNLGTPLCDTLTFAMDIDSRYDYTGNSKYKYEDKNTIIDS